MKPALGGHRKAAEEGEDQRMWKRSAERNVYSRFEVELKKMAWHKTGDKWSVATESNTKHEFSRFKSLSREVQSLGGGLEAQSVLVLVLILRD